MNVMKEENQASRPTDQERSNRPDASRPTVLDIPEPILRYAAHTARHLTPLRRSGGFGEIEGCPRGEGDFLDLVAGLTVFDLVARVGRVCSIDITCGAGDVKDLAIRLKGRETHWNIKASKYAPYRDGLNLFLKSEEAGKPLAGYIQCFVHLAEGRLPPHVHVAGACLTSSPAWREALASEITIPKTGHRGIAIPVASLHPIGTLIHFADRKF